MTKCELFRSDNVKPGWICCACRIYQGLVHEVCRECRHPRCPDPTETVMTTPKKKPGRPTTTLLDGRKKKGLSWNFDGQRRRKKRDAEEAPSFDDAPSE